MKLKQSKRTRSLLLISACLVLLFAAFYSCQKNSPSNVLDETMVNSKALTLSEADRMLSVANVYKTDDGKTIEVWFYETPVVHEFSASGTNAKNYLSLLEKAKSNESPVSVRLENYSENRIEAVFAPTPEKLASFKKERATKQNDIVTQVEKPIDGTNKRLVGVIPNLTMLNTIFNKIQTQCCRAAGPYIYGQCIPFQYVADGCYARAHKMRQIVESYYGYTSYKVFNYACNGAGTLAAKATLWNNNCCVRWWYHVTSYVIVQVGTSQYGYALDPAMFTTPVSIPTWIAAQKNTTCGYNGASQGQVYYTSNAYVPISLSNCVLVPNGDNTYTAANATCAAYASRQGCY